MSCSGLGSVLQSWYVGGGMRWCVCASDGLYQDLGEDVYGVDLWVVVGKLFCACL